MGYSQYLPRADALEDAARAAIAAGDHVVPGGAAVGCRCQPLVSISSVMNCTLPSAMAMWTPPGCLLRMVCLIEIRRRRSSSCTGAAHRIPGPWQTAFAPMCRTGRRRRRPFSASIGTVVVAAGSVAGEQAGAGMAESPHAAAIGFIETGTDFAEHDGFRRCRR